MQSAKSLRSSNSPAKGAWMGSMRPSSACSPWEYPKVCGCAELVTLAVPWHEEAAAPGVAQGAAFRDPIFYVMNSVPNGLRLSFPPLDAIQPPLPELPQVPPFVRACEHVRVPFFCTFLPSLHTLLVQPQGATYQGA